MKEIRFRGKTITTDRWAYGYYFQAQGRHFIIVDTEIIDNIAIPDFVEVKPETVGQYTSEKDKNGRQIYEDDIVVKVCGWIGAAGPAGYKENEKIVVKWDKEITGFIPFVKYDCDCDVYNPPEEFEVIGNIHDNPELLEVNK